MNKEKITYSGMTLNEMLANSNLLSNFDEAVLERNKEELTVILAKIDINEDSAAKIIDTIFGDPKKYGYV